MKVVLALVLTPLVIVLAPIIILAEAIYGVFEITHRMLKGEQV